MTRITILSVALLPAVSFACGAWSMLAVVPVLFLSVLFVLPQAGRDLKRRLHASLLVGTSLAWALLPHTILDFRDHHLPPIATEVPGCQVMALAGFPLQQVSAHGGGGWKTGCHLPSDCLAHAGNCALLALAAWLAIGLMPRRLLAHVHWVAWLGFLPLCFYGWSRMLSWWD